MRDQPTPIQDSNVDPNEVFSRITTALTHFAKTVPGNPVAKVTFNVDPQAVDQWRVTAEFQCLGDIRTKTENMGMAGLFEEAEIDVVFSKTWAAEGGSFPKAVETLAKCVRNFMHHEITQRKKSITNIEHAIGAMDAPFADVLDVAKMWRLADPPSEAVQEESPANLGDTEWPCRRKVVGP